MNVSRLTAREHQVLQLLAGGLIQDSIARHLGVTTRTVRRTTAALYSKLDATTAAQAVAVAFRRGLLGDGPGDDALALWRAAGYRMALVPI